MTSKERIMIQENLKKIENNNFHENDIYIIYLLLRQNINYGNSSHENIVYELSNFVAHNNIRDRGIIIDAFPDFYYVSLYFFNYLLSGEKIDLTGKFQSNIKYLCLNKLNRMDEKTVKNIFGERKSILQRAINKAIICDASNEAIIEKSAPKVIYDIILILLNRIPLDPIFTDNDIIESLLKVLNMHNIKYNKHELLKQKEKIMLSILVLIHHTTITNKLGIKIYCHIYFNIDTNNLSLNLGYLVPNNEWIGFMYEAISTKLNIYNFCSKKLIKRHLMDLSEKNGSVFNCELGLDNEYKLEEKNI